jgi:DNA-binding SARP family transcriptional activator
LELYVLGPFDLRVRGASPAPPLSRKAQWLVTLLALREGREVERSWLAGTLWVEIAEELARYNLRRELTHLRQALGPESCLIQSPSSHTLRLDVGRAAVDVLAFDAALRRGDTSALEEATQLYRGPLLEGCAEDWVIAEREARQQAYLRALDSLAGLAMARADYVAAVAHLRRGIALDPLRESEQRKLMEALAANGEFASATQVFRDLRLLLRRELNTDADPQTTALFHEIRRKARHRAQRPTPKRPMHKRPPTRLPRPLTELIGRENEIRAIEACLSSSRLVTLTGSGGVGKTRLAIQVAENLEDCWIDGVSFVELAALTDSALISHAVAAALSVRELPGRPLRSTLEGFLCSKEMLLVLDNCEHLIGDCANVADWLLAASPGLRILATGRQPLGLTGEVAWRVPSLALPPDPVNGKARGLDYRDKDDVSLLMEYEAARLFVVRASQAHPQFELTARNASAVAQISRRLDGIPLAIELAAARVRAISAQEVAERLDDCYLLLVGGSRAALPRHQT